MYPFYVYNMENMAKMMDSLKGRYIVAGTLFGTRSFRQLLPSLKTKHVLKAKHVPEICCNGKR